MQQRTDEWYQERLGKVTASRIADLTAKTKSGYGASRANYMAELISERLTGCTASNYTNAAMQWGIDHEPEARAMYSFIKDVEVIEIGFIPHPKIENSGASPDGHINDDGSNEIKCPNTATHIETLLSQKIPAKYIKQMQWQMACSGRKWCDFVSYDPRLPTNLQIWIKRINRDDKLINEIENEVKIFLSELESKIIQLKEVA